MTMVHLSHYQKESYQGVITVMDGIVLENQGKLLEREGSREDDRQDGVINIPFPEVYIDVWEFRT